MTAASHAAELWKAFPNLSFKLRYRIDRAFRNIARYNLPLERYGGSTIWAHAAFEHR